MRIMVGACLMITALELDRSNLRTLDGFSLFDLRLGCESID